MAGLLQLRADQGFPSLTKTVLKKLGIRLSYNDDLNNKWEMMTLVKVQKSFTPWFFPPKLTLLDTDLSRLINENISQNYTREVLVKDFQSVISGDVGAIVKGDEVVDLNTGKKDMKAASPATLISEEMEQRVIRDLAVGTPKKKVDPVILDYIKLKDGEKLAFVMQRVYNKSDIEVYCGTSISDSIGNKILKFVDVCFRREKEEKTTFTVPENTVFAFGLREIQIKDGFLDIPISCIMETLSSDSEPFIVYKDDDAVNQFFPMKFGPRGIAETSNILNLDLKPLAELPESSQSDLLSKLVKILEDKDALTLLKNTLDQRYEGEGQRPQPEEVASFMDLLDRSSSSKTLMKAVHLLVSAMEALPDNAAALLGKSGLETLNCINNMVESIKHGQVKLPEDLPQLLQKGGELHWVAKFLHGFKNPAELEKHWDCPDFSPDVLLVLLFISVRGLIMMQPQKDA